MCQSPNASAQATSTGPGRKSHAANRRSQAVWPAALRSAVGTTKKSSGPRSATRISAGATSAIRTCWSMCAESR